MNWNAVCNGPITSCGSANVPCLGIAPSEQILRWQTLQTRRPATASAPWAMRLPPSSSAQIRAAFELQTEHGSGENGAIFPGLLQTLARFVAGGTRHRTDRITRLLSAWLPEHVIAIMFVRLFQIRCHPPR